MGRGPGLNAHSGNVEFRKFVKQYIKKYTQADKTRKTQICQEIVDICKQNNVSFLEKDKANDKWFYITDHTARTKAAQTIQDILKRRERSGADGSSGEEEVATSGVNSEGEEGGNADQSEEEEDGEDVEDGDGGEDVEDRDGDDLKLPALPADSVGIGTVSVSVHSAVAAAVFPEAHETLQLGGEEDISSSPPNRRPEAQLRPAAVPLYLRQLSMEALHESEKGSLHDSDESR